MSFILVNYDNGSRWPVLPQNLYHLKRCLDYQTDIKPRVVDFNLTKKPYSYLNAMMTEYPAVIGLGFISGYWPHREAIKIASVINSNPNRKRVKFIIGGHAPSAAPGYYKSLLGADAVFVGPADRSLPTWVEDGKPDGIIPSAGYTEVSQCYEENLDVYTRIRFPNTKEDEFAIQILGARGCPYNCAFCYRMTDKWMVLNIDNVIADIEYYALRHGITHFQFSDELLMSSRNKTMQWIVAINNLQKTAAIQWRLKFDCNGRLNIAAKHPDLLRKMKRAGFRYVNYGIESMSDEVLRNINKRQTVDEIRVGVANTLEAGLSPGLNFMWGNPGDNHKSLWDAVVFIQQHTDFSELRTIRPVTPYPGTELFKKLEITVGEFYKKHVNSDLFSFHFMNKTNRDADQMLFQANEQIIKHHYRHKVEKQLVEVQHFYDGKTPPESFRGFREV